MFYSGDNIGAIVADIGSYACRVGFAGEDSPRAYIPSAIAASQDNQSNSEISYQFSPYKYSPGVKIQIPTHESIISDWDLLERIWEYSLQNFLKTDVAGLPVLAAEKPYNTPELRHKLCELMFEKYQASAFFLAKDSTLACYACGKTTGIVVDCGASGTLVTPVIDGWTEMKAVIKSPVGGRLMDAFMLKLVSQKIGVRPKPMYRLSKTTLDNISGNPLVTDAIFNEPIHPSFDSYMNLELGRDIKESVGICCTEGSLTQAEAKLSILPTTPYELPDGTNIDMGIERYQVPELFFDRTISNDVEIDNLFSASSKLPVAMPLSSDNLPQMIQNSLYRCDMDGSINNMLQNIILSGGNSCYRGLQERLKVEVEIKSQNARVKVHAASDVERSSDKADKMKSVIDRAICPWLGGSIMGSLGSFHDIWISKKEYYEYGSSIVDSKCP